MAGQSNSTVQLDIVPFHLLTGFGFLFGSFTYFIGLTPGSHQSLPAWFQFSFWLITPVQWVNPTQYLSFISWFQFSFFGSFILFHWVNFWFSLIISWSQFSFWHLQSAPMLLHKNTPWHQWLHHSLTLLLKYKHMEYWNITSLIISHNNNNNNKPQKTKQNKTKQKTKATTRPVNSSEHSHMLRMHFLKFDLFFDLWPLNHKLDKQVIADILWCLSKANTLTLLLLPFELVWNLTFLWPLTSSP